MLPVSILLLRPYYHTGGEKPSERKVDRHRRKFRQKHSFYKDTNEIKNNHTLLPSSNWDNRKHWIYYSVLDWSSVESRFNLLAVGATNVRPVATKTMMNAVKMIRRTEVWNKLLLQRNERTRMDNAARVRNRCPARNLKI